MSVTVRSIAKEKWLVDVQVMLPSGRPHRERRKVRLTSKTNAVLWGQTRERELLLHGPTPEKQEVPTLEQFAPRFLDGNARANRQKPSGIAAKETILRVHLVAHSD